MIRNLDIPLCPVCNSRLYVRDTRTRKVIDADGKSKTYILRRLRCYKCNKIHTEIPDFIQPNKQYSRTAIESYLSGSDDISADNKTLYRWKNKK